MTEQLTLPVELGFDAVDSLVQIRQLGEELQCIARKISNLMLEANELSSRQKTISEQLLPDLMTQAGLTELKLADGTVVRLEEVVYASFPPEEDPRRGDVVAYMRQRGAANLIKNSLVIDKGYDEVVQKIEDDLVELGVPFRSSETVHPQTFGKFVREQAKEDPEFPKETFKLYEGWKVKFK